MALMKKIYKIILILLFSQTMSLNVFAGSNGAVELTEKKILNKKQLR